PPLFKGLPVLCSSPPHTIISLSVQTAVCMSRALGAFAVLVAVQLLLFGLYFPPPLSTPPHTIISAPVHTALWNDRAAGALMRLVAVNVSLVQAACGTSEPDMAGSLYSSVAGAAITIWLSAFARHDSNDSFGH